MVRPVLRILLQSVHCIARDRRVRMRPGCRRRGPRALHWLGWAPRECTFPRAHPLCHTPFRMSQANPVRLFVTHAWVGSDDYLRVFEYLESARNFFYRNYSTPEHSPGGDKEAQRE